MDPGVLVALLLIFSAATLLYQGYAILLGYQMTPVNPGTFPVPEGTPVAVVIAARNEADEIGRCLEALVASRLRPAEIVVVDGGSTDGTAAVAARFPGVRVLPEPPLPDGWIGKNWACETGARATSAPFVLFLDADVRIHPDAIGQAVGWAEAEHADLVTYATRIEMEGFWERVVMPFYTQMVLTYFRAPRVNRPGSRAAMANGQFLLVRRRAYEAIGGHASVAGAIVEDVALARRFRDAGRPMRVGWAPDLAVTRMYRDRHELFEGLLKTAADNDFSALRQLALIGGLVGFFFLPLAVAPAAFALRSLPLEVVGGFLWIALFGKHVAFARAVRGPGAYGLLYPLAAAFFLAVLVVALARGLAGRPTVWKGRSYARGAAGASPRAPPSP